LICELIIIPCKNQINILDTLPGFFNLSYLYMAEKLQALIGGNSMIKGVMSDPKQMAMAQEMMNNPEVQKQIGGVFSNPAIIKQASEVLNGLHQMNSVQAGGKRCCCKSCKRMCSKSCKCSKRRKKHGKCTCKCPPCKYHFRKKRTKKKYQKKRTNSKRRRTKKKRRKRR